MPMPVGGRLGRSSRFLVEFDYRDGLDRNGLPVFRSGQIPSYARGGTVNSATGIDRNGRLYTAGPVQPRYQHEYDAATGLWVPKGLLLEGGRTNPCWPASDATSGRWAKAATTTAEKDATGPDGVANSASTLTHASGAGVADAWVAGSAVGAGTTQSISGCIKKGNTTWCFVRDTGDAGVHATWINLDTGEWGTQIDLIARTLKVLGNGWYRWSVTYTTTNAYTPRVDAGPASADNNSASSIGATVLVALHEHGLNAAFDSSPIPTTTAAVTCSADALSCAFNTTAAQLAVIGVTLYDKIVVQRYNEINAATSIGIADLNAFNKVSAYIATSGNVIGVMSGDGVSSVSTLAVTLAVGDVLERLVTVTPTGVATLSVSVNGGAVSAGAPGTACDWPVAFANARVYFNEEATADRKGDMVRALARIAAGVKSMDYMQAGN